MLEGESRTLYSADRIQSNIVLEGEYRALHSADRIQSNIVLEGNTELYIRFIDFRAE